MNDLTDTLGAYAFRILIPFFNALPEAIALLLGRLAGGFVFFFSGRRRVAYADLKAALGSSLTESQRWRVIRDHYGHLGQMFAEVLRFPQLNREAIHRNIHFDHPARFLKALEEGDIFVTAHFGNWELLQIITGILGKPVRVLARNQRHPRMNECLNRLRQIHGSVAISRGIGIRDFLRSLRRKEPVGLVGDQDAGKHGGLILSFFGRKTTVPTGAFELARRTGAPILPCFIARLGGPRHEVYVPEKIPQSYLESENGLEEAVRFYLKTLEDFIRKYPSQWLWESKRWKYTWTKRLLVLSDGKPGHVKQSQAVAAQFQTVTSQYGRAGMEYPTEIIDVKFKSGLHKKLFSLFALCFIPFAQGRLRLLRFFFTPESQKAIENASADFIISAGSSLVPLNLCLSRDSCAKSIVIMKPSFPYNLFRYDLALIPEHDGGVIPPDAFRMLLAPAQVNPEVLEESSSKLAAELRDFSKVRLGIFIGGPTGNFVLKKEAIEKLFETVDRISSRLGDYLVTTSRRTPEEVSQFLKNEIAGRPACQMIVIATEDPRPEVVSGIMGIADILIVTADSVSMISEAVQSGKKVIVLNVPPNGLPSKHKRFQEILERQSAIVTATDADLEEKIQYVSTFASGEILQRHQEALKRKLEEIL